MARYRIAHYPSRDTWLCRSDDGSFYWKESCKASEAHLFPNYRQARAALDSMPDEKLMYGESYKTKCLFMKFYDSKEHFEQEQEYLADRRVLRDWGY